MRLHVAQELFERFRGIGRLRTHLAELTDQLGLTVARNLTVARKGCEHGLVAEVLAPGLELLRCVAKALAELGQGSAEAVRIEVWKSGLCEGLLEDLPDGGGG